MSQSLVTAELITVYQQSNYQVFGEPDFCLNIARTSTELLALYQKHSAGGAVFISACNPRSECISDAINTGRSLDLYEDLKPLKLPIYPAEGQDPSGNWPSERSFLILGMPLSVGAELGRQYGQNAILYCAKDSTVELVLLR
jgi:hypothetical protein